MTIKVPVQLTKIHQNIEKIRIVCNVFDEQEVELGAGNAERTIPTGNLQEEFSIEIVQHSGKNLLDARSYKCTLQLSNGEFWGIPNEPGIGNIEHQAKENTTFVARVSGQIQ
jgi:hypothetical protein